MTAPTIVAAPAAATTHTSGLFATWPAVLMRPFEALHDVQWRAPWDDSEQHWVNLR